MQLSIVTSEPTRFSGAEPERRADLDGVRIRVMAASDLFRRPVLAEGMFRDRAAQFKRRLGWGALKLDDLGLEYDQYDRPDSCYLALEDAQGRHCASGRVLPTTGPTMINDFFSDACGGPIRDPRTWEVTRICVSPRLARDGALRRAAIPALLWAGQKIAMEIGVRAFIGVYYPLQKRYYTACGVAPEKLGEMRDEGGVIEAGMWRVNPAMRDHLAARAGALARRGVVRV